MRKLFNLFLLIMVFLTGCCMKDEMGFEPGQSEQILQSSGGDFKYLLYLPGGYFEDSKREWPIMFFLHGAGERGDDLSMVKRHGPAKLIESGREFDFIVVSPQCRAEGWWTNEEQMGELEDLYDFVVSNLRVDLSRVYLTGLSMGGFGTWEWAIRQPERFAAIAPICGGGDSERVFALKDVPVWAFHGEKDKTVPFEKSQVMVEALKGCGGQVRFTAYPDVDHDSWTRTYENDELFEWFMSKNR